MKFIIVVILISISLISISAVEKDDSLEANIHVQLVIDYLKKQDKSERLYLRALSGYNIDDKTNKPLLDWTINHLHLEPAPTPMKEISPNLYIIDIRDYGWSPAIFSKVARREFYFREPFINHELASTLRHLIEVEQDKDTLHVEGIIRADWFFRETMESDRSPSYYELLFAKFNYVEVEIEVEEDWKGGYDPRYKKDYPPGKYTVKKKIKKESKGRFPKDEKDFEKAFGVDKVFDFIKETGINTQRGAVVEGGEKNISIVARQNRLLFFTKGPVGIYAKTFDVKETTGKRDFAETLQKNFVYDAGEILADTPCGALAALLVNSEGKILETADNRFATDKSDLVLDARVRTPGSCFICHESGYIRPNNLIEDMVKKGVDIRFRSKRDQIDAKAFFLRWGTQVEDWQKPHISLASELFHDLPAKRAVAFKKYRDQYDAPVTLDIAIRELGITKEKFIIYAAKSTKARINNLVVGISMPRKTWEVDGFKEMVLQMNGEK